MKHNHVNSPLSVAGAWGRSRYRVGRALSVAPDAHPALRYAARSSLVTAAVLVGAAHVALSIAWLAVILVTLPVSGIFRLFRRGTRKRAIQQRQHEELLAALKEANGE